VLRLGLAAVALLVLSGCGANGTRLGVPPSGLTPYGRVVWNLDALLHDSFGNRQVWENYARSNGTPNYSTRFVSGASSTPYTYTFAAARSSTFKAVRPEHPPRSGTYVTGENFPVRVRGAYVSCGRGTWLYERNGQSFSGGNMWCSVGPLAP
jgi:hypothetical protein